MRGERDNNMRKRSGQEREKHKAKEYQSKSESKDGK